MKSDQSLVSRQVIALIETWLTPDQEHPELADYACLRHDLRPETTHRPGGLIMYIHYEFHLVRQLRDRDVSFEYEIVLLSPWWNPDARICVIVLYKNLPQMEKVLIPAPIHSVPTFIMGILNIDYLSMQGSTKELRRLMTHFGITQHVKKLTHRRGGLLDHLYYNRQSPFIQVHTKALYYSDHLQLCSYPISYL